MLNQLQSQNYLPKMSIPVEKRELGDGWILSCHGIDGGGLTLTDVTIRRDNLVCQIMGGDTLFFPMFTDNNECVHNDSISVAFSTPTESLSTCTTHVRYENEEESILDHIKVLILNAQKYGCWKVGFGGVSQVRTRNAWILFHCECSIFYCFSVCAVFFIHSIGSTFCSGIT
jgi:hypothetical protein